MVESGADGTEPAATVTLCLAGDVMTGRGVDQILPHPGDPGLRERWVRDARDYVAMAERVGGAIPRPVGYAWPWGDALAAVDRMAPAFRVVNLETAITRRGRFAPGKTIHYRMCPDNLACLVALRPDVAVLANNHVLDFGRAGLGDTLTALSDAGIAAAGAGLDRDRARSPAVLAAPSGARIIVLATGTPSAGVTAGWAAGHRRPGVDVTAALTPEAAEEITGRLRAVRRPGDIAVVSVHWGSNWGLAVTPDQTAFAHRLVDGGADIVHGHSSHHPRPIEVYHGRLILYGCGDLVNDYEGIAGFEEFRPDLRALYFPEVRLPAGELDTLTVIVLRSRRMRLWEASGQDTAWLASAMGPRSRGIEIREAASVGDPSEIRIRPAT